MASNRRRGPGIRNAAGSKALGAVGPVIRPLQGKEITKRDLTCTVCLDRLKEPRLLPCLHTYCKGCLEKTVRGKSNITCPQCRSSHAVPMGGVGGFPADLVLQNAVDNQSLQESKESAKPIPCNMCTEDDPATAHCPTCSKFLCDFCCKAHKRLVDYRNHKVVPLDKVDTEAMKAFERPRYCAQHTEEVLKLYCKTCNVLICRDCTIVNHRDHKFGFVKDIRPEIQQQLQEMKQVISLKQQEFQKHLEYTKSAERSRQTHSSALERKINTSFDAAIAKLESQRKQLLQQEVNARSTDMKQIWAQKESVEVTLANIAGSLGYIERLCSCPNDRDMLAMSSEAIKQLSSLQEKYWSPRSGFSLLMLTESTFSTEAMGTLEGVSFNVSTVQPPSSAHSQRQGFPSQYVHNTAVSLGQRVQLTVQVTSNNQELSSLAVPSISIIDNARGNTLTAYTMQHQGHGSWLLTIEPLHSGHYSVQAFGSQNVTAQPHQLFNRMPMQHGQYQFTVTGAPAIGARVRRGPNWQYGNQDGGQGGRGTVTQHEQGYQQPGLFRQAGTPVSVKWDNGNSGTYTWDENSAVFPIELVPGFSN